MVRLLLAAKSINGVRVSLEIDGWIQGIYDANLGIKNNFT